MQTTLTSRPDIQFWDKIASKYARKPIADPDAYEEKLRRVRYLLRPTDSVLELGCGTGSTAISLAPSVARITATDASFGMIRIAKSKLSADAAKSITFLVADAHHRVASEPFDALLAFNLFHLVEDLPRVLERAHSELKPGGLLITKTECLKQRNLFLRAIVPVMTWLGLAPRVAPLSVASLSELIECAGFEIEQTAFLNGQRANPFIVARRSKA